MNSYLLLTVLCTAIAAYGLSPESAQIVKVAFEDCTASTGADPEAIRKLRRGEFVSDPKVDEFAFCYFKTLRLMNDAGEFQFDDIKTIMSREFSAADTKTVIEDCKDVTGKDRNQKAYNAYKCYWNSASKYIDLSE